MVSSDGHDDDASIRPCVSVNVLCRFPARNVVSTLAMQPA